MHWMQLGLIRPQSGREGIAGDNPPPLHPREHVLNPRELVPVAQVLGRERASELLILP